MDKITGTLSGAEGVGLTLTSPYFYSALHSGGC